MSDSDSSLPVWDPVFVFPMQTIVVGAAVACLGYGTFLVVAILAIRALLRRGISLPSQHALLTAAVVFLLSATILCVADFAFQLANMALGPYNDNPGAMVVCARTYIIQIVCERIIFLLNDGLVVWRAWVLADRLIFRLMLAFVMLTTIGCTIAEAVLGIRAGFLAPITLTSKFLFLIPLVANNFFATVLVLYKTWIYRTEIKRNLYRSSQKTQVESVLFLLIESGFLYCGWWIMLMIATYVETVPFMFYQVVTILSPFAAAIYPMLIILVVEHQKSREEARSTKGSERTLSRPIQFRTPGQQSSDNETQTISIIQSVADIQLRQIKIPKTNASRSDYLDSPEEVDEHKRSIPV